MKTVNMVILHGEPDYGVEQTPAQNAKKKETIRKGIDLSGAFIRMCLHERQIKK